MHSQAADRLATYSAMLFIPAVVLNGVIASMSFSTESTNVAIGILNVVAGGLMLVDRTFELGTSRDRHRECAMLFSKVGRSISGELCLPYMDRMMDGHEFLRFAGFEADRILQMNVSIPGAIVNAFQKKYGNDPTELHEIKVYPRREENSSSSSSSSEEDEESLRRSMDNLKQSLCR